MSQHERETMTYIKLNLLLLTLIPSIASAVPWCYKQTKLVLPSASQSVHWTGAMLQNKINNTNITCAYDSHYQEGCKAQQAIEKYCKDTYSSPNGSLPTRTKWWIPSGGYNFNVISGATFQCELCSDGRLIKLPFLRAIKFDKNILQEKPVKHFVLKHEERKKIPLNKLMKKQPIRHTHGKRTHKHILPITGKSHQHGKGAMSK